MLQRAPRAPSAPLQPGTVTPHIGSTCSSDHWRHRAEALRVPPTPWRLAQSEKQSLARDTKVVCEQHLEQDSRYTCNVEEHRDLVAVDFLLLCFAHACHYVHN